MAQPPSGSFSDLYEAMQQKKAPPSPAAPLVQQPSSQQPSAAPAPKVPDARLPSVDPDPYLEGLLDRHLHGPDRVVAVVRHRPQVAAGAEGIAPRYSRVRTPRACMSRVLNFMHRTYCPYCSWLTVRALPPWWAVARPVTGRHRRV